MLPCRHHAFQRTDCPLPPFLSVFSPALGLACLLRFDKISFSSTSNGRCSLSFFLDLHQTTQSFDCLCGPSSVTWNLGFCSLSPFQCLKTTVVVSPQRTTCIYLGAASRLSLVSASFRNSFETESSVHNSVLLQFRYPTLGPKLCLEYLSNWRSLLIFPLVFQ